MNDMYGPRFIQDQTQLGLLCPSPRVGCIKRWCASDVCLSVAYIGPKSRTKTPRKTKIGTEVADVTRDSDTTIKIKGQRSTCRRRGILWRLPAQLVIKYVKAAAIYYHNILPRNAMRERGLCCRPVSLRLSVTLVDCIHSTWLKISSNLKLLVRPSSPIILVFWPLVLIPNSKGNPLIQQGRKIHGDWKIFRFSTEIAV